MQRADAQVYAIECWDSSPVYLRSDEKVQSLRDIGGRLVEDVPEGEPALMTGDLPFGQDDSQSVNCQTVQVTPDDVWWTACVRHTTSGSNRAGWTRRPSCVSSVAWAVPAGHVGRPGMKPTRPSRGSTTCCTWT